MIGVERADAVATLVVDRPDAMNALDVATLTELRERLLELRDDGDVRVVVLTGAGERAFIAGADIKAMSGMDVAQAKAWGELGHNVAQLLETSPKATIAAVNGFALGGGCELAMACHLRIASETAKFGQPEVKLGIAPGYGGTQRLPRLVGKGHALHLILTGEMIDAQEAYRIGLVNKVVPPAELLPTTERTLRGILAMGPLAVRLALEAVDQGLEMTLDQGLLLEANHFGLLAATRDMKEGLTAFLEKRAPRFEGR